MSVCNFQFLKRLRLHFCWRKSHAVLNGVFSTGSTKICRILERVAQSSTRSVCSSMTNPQTRSRSVGCGRAVACSSSFFFASAAARRSRSRLRACGSKKMLLCRAPKLHTQPAGNRQSSSHPRVSATFHLVFYDNFETLRLRGVGAQQKRRSPLVYEYY